MTTERNNMDGVGDARLSDAYRAAARERTPPELDAKILAAARAAAKTPYSRAVFFLRPMAWAATIGLSLAIVLELSNLPQPDAVTPPAPAMTAPLREGSSEAANAMPERDDAMHLEPRANERTLEFKASAPAEEAAAAAPAAPATAAASGSDAEARAADANRPKLEAGRQAAANEAMSGRESDLDAFRVREAPILDQAADMARTRDVQNLEGPGAGAPSAIAVDAAVARACSAEQTADPERWLDCIEDLEAGGSEEAAELERDRLLEAFPNFELPPR